MSRERRRRRQERPQAQVVSPGLLGGQYKPLSPEALRQIHEASLTVLEQTGIEVMPSECREIFRQGGARSDEANNRVFIPRKLVEKALANVPREVHLCGRDPQHDLILSSTRVYMGTGGAAVKVLDLESQKVRESS